MGIIPLLLHKYPFRIFQAFLAPPLIYLLGQMSLRIRLGPTAIPRTGGELPMPGAIPLPIGVWHLLIVARTTPHPFGPTIKFLGRFKILEIQVTQLAVLLQSICPWTGKDYLTEGILG